MSTLQETAARIGRHQWLEQSVWRVLGGWAASEATAGAAVLLDTHAQHAAWRAGQWWDRLPVLAGIRREDLVRPGDTGVRAVIEALGGQAEPDSTVGRLAVAYRVLLPRVVVAYRHEAPLLSPVTDGPARRTLAQVASDAGSDWLAGEAFLQGLLSDGAAVDEAAAAVAGLERLAAGDPAGEAAQ